ncbi:Poly(A) polymerase pla1 [Cucumispora dikerogammari]|nr:Poly(A) polymerase pla1 [Cucumispora dikerogammari]
MLNNPKHGVTGPVSLKKPTEEEEDLTTAISEYLKESNFYEEESESINRERSLGKISFIFDEFVKNCAKKFDITIESKPMGIIYSFGSYRLGVHSKGADIDTLCIGPSYVDRKDFFTEFYNMLKNSEYITEVVNIETAHVPMIGIKISDISIDLVYAKLNVKSFPINLDILDNKILKNLDEKCVVSLNGSRVSSEILRLVPNTTAFHGALRCIKLWATKRYIYGNAYGYFGGVAFAITVARICQLYPNGTASTIIKKYFEVLSKWKWPNPIILKEIENCHYNLKVWNPKLNPADKYHKMPIITPAYPSMCSTHNVSHSTMQRIFSEFQRASTIMKKKSQDFKELFAPSDFFETFDNFLLIFSVGKVKTSDFEENFTKFTGFVASRLRSLITRWNY